MNLTGRLQLARLIHLQVNEGTEAGWFGRGKIEHLQGETNKSTQLPEHAKLMTGDRVLPGRPQDPQAHKGQDWGETMLGYV